jgi:uncharacterized membrane protein HdeD (DUF308 family)
MATATQRDRDTRTNLDVLVRNRWMMAVRGALAIVLGTVLVAWPEIGLGQVVVLFGAYAIVDGAWTVAAGTRAARRYLEAWPVLFEGLVSVGLGIVALSWPFHAAPFVPLLALWGVGTGLLELVTAFLLVPGTAGRWLLATAGVTSLFLAVLVLLIPYATADLVVRIIAGYAFVFGVVGLLVAIRFPGHRQGDVRNTA